MINQSQLIRLMMRGLFGGILAVVALFSGIVALTVASENPADDALQLAVASAAFVASALGAVWVAGFWGRWGMLVFFVFAPVVIILDYNINPLFPVGVIVFAGLCYAVAPFKNNDV